MMACQVTRENLAKEMVELLLNAGANIEHRNKAGITPLMNAAKRGFPLVCTLLLNRGAKMDEEDPKGKTAYKLCRDAKTREAFENKLRDIELQKYAAEIARKGKVVWDCMNRNNMKALEDLGEEKANTPKEAFNWFIPKPKPKAIVKEEEEKPKSALDKALDEHANKKDAMRAKLAAKKAKAAEEDISKKMKPLKATIRVPTSIHQPPLHFACINRNVELVNTLLFCGANPNVKQMDGRSALHILAALPRLHAWPETKKSIQREQNRAKMVQDLIDFEADLNTQDNRGRTPLMVAAYEGFEDIVDLLIMEGAEIDMTDKVKDTALIIAAKRGRSTAVKALINGGCNVNAVGHEKMTPLMWAAYWGRVDLIEMLCENGADAGINMRSYFGQTALMWAVDNRENNAILALLKIDGIDCNIGLITSTPPIVSACRQNLPEDIVQAMLDTGADPNGKSFEGYRALHWTVLNVNERLCRIMLYAGANPLLENTNGLSSIEMAVTVKMRIMLAEASEMYKDGKKNITKNMEKK
jgi:ankyrin repeat protein